ncbi:hypothetical protein AK88_01989 [Plasmodium fragile]|uniref:6-Cys domain-containing protein n=1 Tax=Plasmodium fragile TaxID=5857 RepID=A0A0D9QN71_PLAFR|nr:uncharacterized protein AK88_01989 [Plasmodium fragile]KJP88373.1 hypothetical protein AK88_01989 [Plasmodium fragile]
MWDTAYLKRVTLISFFLVGVKYLEYFSIKKEHRNERTKSFAEPESAELGLNFGGCARKQKTLTNFPTGFPLHSSNNGVPENYPEEVALSANGHIKRHQKGDDDICTLDQSNPTLCYNGVTFSEGESCAKPVPSALIGMKNNNWAWSDKDDFYKNGNEKNALVLGRNIVKRISSLFFKLLDECAQVKYKLANLLDVFLTIGGTRKLNLLSPPGNIADSNAYTFTGEDKIYRKNFYHPDVLFRNGYITTEEQLFPFQYTHFDRVRIINSEGITNGTVLLDEWLEEETYQQGYESKWDKVKCKIVPLGKDIMGMSPNISGRRLSDTMPILNEGDEDGGEHQEKEDKRKDYNEGKKDSHLDNGYAVIYHPIEQTKSKRICRILSPQCIYQTMEHFGNELEGTKKKETCINCRILSERNSKSDDKDKDKNRDTDKETDKNTDKNKDTDKDSDSGSDEDKDQEKDKNNEQRENDENEKKYYKKPMCRILQENDGEPNRWMNDTDGIRGEVAILAEKGGKSCEKCRQFRILLEQDQTSYHCASGKGEEGSVKEQVSAVCDRKCRQLAIIGEEYSSPDDEYSYINVYDGNTSDGNGSSSRIFSVLAQEGPSQDDTKSKSEGGNVGRETVIKWSGGNYVREGVIKWGGRGGNQEKKLDVNNNWNSSNTAKHRLIAQEESQQEGYGVDMDDGDEDPGIDVGESRGTVDSGKTKNPGDKSDGKNNGNDQNSRITRFVAEDAEEHEEPQIDGGAGNKGDQSKGNTSDGNDPNSSQYRVDGRGPKGHGGAGNTGDQSKGKTSDGNDPNSRQFRVLSEDTRPDGDLLEVDGRGPKGHGGAEDDRQEQKKNENVDYNCRFRSLAEEDSSEGGNLQVVPGSSQGKGTGSGGTGNEQGNNGGNDSVNSSQCRSLRLLSEDVSPRGYRNYNADGEEPGDSVADASPPLIRRFRILIDDDPIIDYNDLYFQGECIGSGIGGGNGANGGGGNGIGGSGNPGGQSNGDNSGSGLNGRRFRILVQEGSSPTEKLDNLDGSGDDDSQIVNPGGGNDGNNSGNVQNCRQHRLLGEDYDDDDDDYDLVIDDYVEGRGNGNHAENSDGKNNREYPIITHPRVLAQEGSSPDGRVDESDGGSRNKGNTKHAKGDDEGSITTQSSALSDVHKQKKIIKGSDEAVEGEFGGSDRGENTNEINGGNSTHDINAALLSSAGLSSKDGLENSQVGYQEDDEEEEAYKGKYDPYGMSETTQSVNNFADGRMKKQRGLIKGSSGEWGDYLKSSTLSTYRNYGDYRGYSSQAASPNYADTQWPANYKNLFSESPYIYRKGSYYFINPSPFSIIKMKQQGGVRPDKGSRDYVDCYATWFSTKYNSAKGNEYSYRHIKQIEEIIPGALTGFKNDDGYMRLMVPSFIPEDMFLHCIFRSESFNGMLDSEGHINRTETYPVKIYLKKNLNKTKGCSFQVNEGNILYKEYAQRESFLTKKIIMNEKNKSNNECVIEAWNEIVAFQCGPPYIKGTREKHHVDDYNFTGGEKENNLISPGVSEGDFFRTDPPYCFEHVNENQNLVDILPSSFPFPSSNMLAGQIQGNHTRYIKLDKYSDSRTIACYCNYYKENSILYSGKIIIRVQPSHHAQLNTKGGHLAQSDARGNFVQGMDQKMGAANEDMNLSPEKNTSHRGKNYDTISGNERRDNNAGSAHGGENKGAVSSDYMADKTRKNPMSNFDFNNKEGINGILFKNNRMVSSLSYAVIKRFGDKFKGEYVEDLPLEDGYGGEGYCGGDSYTDLDGEPDMQEHDDLYNDAYTDAYEDSYDDMYTEAHTDPYSNLEGDVNGDFLFDLNDKFMNEKAPSKHKPLDRSVDLQDSIVHAGESQTITVINKSKNVKLVLPKDSGKEKSDGGDRELSYPKVISIVYEEKANKHEKVNKSLKLFKEFFPPVHRDPQGMDAKKNVESEGEVDSLEADRDISERGKDELVDEEQDEEDMEEWIKWENQNDGKVEKEGRDVTDGKDKIDSKEEKDWKEEEDVRDFIYHGFTKEQKNKTHNSIDTEIISSGDDANWEKENDERGFLSAADEQVLMKRRRRGAKNSPSGEQAAQEKGRARRDVKRQEQTKRTHSAQDDKQGSDSSSAAGDEHRGQHCGEKKEHLEGLREEQEEERRGRDKIDQVEGRSKQMQDSKKGWSTDKEDTDAMIGEIGEGKESDRGDEEKGGENEKSEAKNPENDEPQRSRKSKANRKKRMR